MHGIHLYDDNTNTKTAWIAKLLSDKVDFGFTIRDKDHFVMIKELAR